MTFVKGQTGNAGGRPKGLARLVRETIGDEGFVDIVREMFDIAVGANREAEPKDQIAAAKWLAERGYGRPHQSIDVTSDGKPVGSATVTVSLPTGQMTDAELAAMREALEKAGAPPAPEDDGERAPEDE